MSRVTFYRCSICGNIVEMVNNSGRPLTCCSREMSELFPGITDGAKEKHVPVYSLEESTLTVCVGSQLHPSEPDHYIEWVECVTNLGTHRMHLGSNCKPIATFHLAKDETPQEVYAYCNKHGLWKK